MRKIIALLILGLAVGLTACKDDDDEWVIWDYNPYVLTINIQDAEGNNLLDPAVENNVTSETIEMYYNHKFYAMYNYDDLFQEKSRYYMPSLWGLRRIQKLEYEEDVDKPWRLEWGEFDRAVSGEYKFSLSFTDRNCAPYDFELKITNSGDGETREELKLNGQKLPDPSECTIVLP